MLNLAYRSLCVVVGVVLVTVEEEGNILEFTFEIELAVGEEEEEREFVGSVFERICN